MPKLATAVWHLRSTARKRGPAGWRLIDAPWRPRRPAHRRHGPRRPSPLARVLGPHRRKHLKASRRRPVWRWMRGLVAVYVPAAVAVTTARKRLGVPPAVTLGVVSATPLAVAALTPRGRVRYAAAGMAYMWVFKVTWELPYDDPDELRDRVRVRYPIRVDSVLGGGVPPGLRLQRALRDPSRVTALDRAVAVVYGSWFLPHAVLGYVWLRHPEYVPRAAGRLAASYQITTPFYALVPTAPPWWASEIGGEMGGEMQRVLRHVVRDLRGKPRQESAEGPGNPWGSMPSDHVASAAITAMGLSELGPVYGALGWSYVALASFSVVYLGEHYVVDVLAGLALAELIRLAEPVVSPLVRHVAHRVERLAP